MKYRVINTLGNGFILGEIVEIYPGCRYYNDPNTTTAYIRISKDKYNLYQFLYPYQVERIIESINPNITVL